MPATFAIGDISIAGKARSYAARLLLYLIVIKYIFSVPSVGSVVKIKHEQASVLYLID